MKFEKGNLFYSATSATSSGGMKGGDAGTSGGIDSDKKMKTNLVKRRNTTEGNLDGLQVC